MNKFTTSGIPANYHTQVEGSQIDHIHRWTNAKRLNKLENGSKLIILRCRRCEIMKSTEIFIEYKDGRAIAKRVDRIIESLPTNDLNTQNHTKDQINSPDDLGKLIPNALKAIQSSLGKV